MIIEKNKKEAEKKINAAYDKVKAGKSFVEVLKEYRSGEQYEISLQGYYKPDSFDSELSEAVSALKVGDTTKPIFTSNAYISNLLQHNQ